MRRIFMALTACILIGVVFCACGVSKGYQKDKMTPVNESAGNYFIVTNIVDIGEDITVKFENRDSLTWFFGEYYSIQVLLDKTWYYVPTVSEWAVHDLGHELDPGQSTTMTYSLLPYGKLQPGHYRIACGDVGNSANIYYAFFDVTEESKMTWTVTNPTGLPNGYYEQPMIMYNGVLYKYYATGIEENLPEGFELVGEIETFDWKAIPSEDFQATGTELVIGQKIYANPDKPDEIIVRYDEGEGWTGYGSFYSE